MTTHWTPEEDMLMRVHIGYETMPELSRRLRRSVRGIQYRHQQRYGALSHAMIAAHGMSVSDCASEMGVHRARIHDWIAHGWLRAHVQTIYKRRLYAVSADDLRTFLMTIGGLFAYLHPSPRWRATVEAAQHACRTRYIDTHELAAIFCLIPRLFTRGGWVDTVRFPPPAMQLQNKKFWYERAAVREWLQTTHPRYQTPRALRAFGLDGG